MVILFTKYCYTWLHLFCHFSSKKEFEFPRSIGGRGGGLQKITLEMSGQCGSPIMAIQKGWTGSKVRLLYSNQLPTSNFIETPDHHEMHCPSRQFVPLQKIKLSIPLPWKICLGCSPPPPPPPPPQPIMKVQFSFIVTFL